MPKRNECRQGRHEYTTGSHVGAGIRRDSCRVCGAVRIDLAAEAEREDGRPLLFAGASRHESFLIRVEPDLPPERTFGKARRR